MLALRSLAADRANLHRLFALHLLALISSKRPGDSSASTNLPSSPSSDEPDSDDEDEHRKGLLNSDGAWCFKDDCDGALLRLTSVGRSRVVADSLSALAECLSLTKAMQGAAEAIADVADLEIQHVRPRAPPEDGERNSRADHVPPLRRPTARSSRRRSR